MARSVTRGRRPRRPPGLLEAEVAEVTGSQTGNGATGTNGGLLTAVYGGSDARKGQTQAVADLSMRLVFGPFVHQEAACKAGRSSAAL